MRFRTRFVSRTRSTLSGRPRTLTAAVSALAIALFLTVGYVAWFSYDLTATLPNREELRGLGDMAQSTTIYDAKDQPAFTLFKEQRIEVPLEKISPHLIKAVLSIEDQRFYEHTGVDAIRVAAAVLKNVKEGRRAEGGSTITQQLARQSFLTRDKTYRRKLKEVILAGHIESEYTKEEILALYLNKVYFGDGLYGVEAAARGYLGKNAADLTVDEAALLAGLIQSPSSYAPTVNLDRALARRAVVLNAMASSGAIDQAAADAAKKMKVKLTNSLEMRETYGLYFKEAVRRELVDKFGWQRVYQGGLKVYTTMDPDLQKAAEAIVERGLVEIEGRSNFKHPRRTQIQLKEGESPAYLQAALVSVDPSNGHVVALVGGRDFNESRFNRVTQAKRQPGSAFKPLIFAAALEAGHTPASVITNLDDPIETLQGKWVPEDEHSTATSMTLRTALRTSSNRAAVQLLNTVGIQKAVNAAEKLNVGTPPSVPSIALGTGDVTLLALTAAYGAFASEGIVRQPTMIRKITDSDGTALYEAEHENHRAVSEATAFLMSSMLTDVVNAGTGYRARQSGFTLPAAGKTGTTNDYLDAWFIGFTPKVVTGVWLGFDQPTTIISNGYAGELAVPMWANYMKTATKGHKPEWLNRPANVVGLNICRVSGRRPNEGCNRVEVVSNDGTVEARSMIYTEYFVKGTEPSRDLCPLHNAPTFFDRLAGVFGAGDEQKPVSAEEVGVTAPRATSTSGTTPPATGAPASRPADPPKAETPEEPKKRGFWSRLFGKGDKKDDKDKKDPPKKPGGGG